MNQERFKRFLIVRKGPTQNKKRKRGRRNELGKRSIKPNARRLPHQAGRIQKTKRIQPTKDHQLNHRRKKHKSSLFLLYAKYRD
jgi:hypothetical protein